MFTCRPTMHSLKYDGPATVKSSHPTVEFKIIISMFTCRPALGNLKYCMMAPATVKSSHPSVEFEIIINYYNINVYL